MKSYFRRSESLTGVVKNDEKEHRSDPHDDENPSKEDGSPKKKSLETVELPAGNGHTWDL